MKKKIIVFAIIIMCINLYVDKSFSFAKKDIDLFNEMLKTTSAKTEEYGIKVTFEISEEPETFCLDTFKKLNYNTNEINIVKKDEYYCLEFNNDAIKGYIESAPYDNHNVVTINLTQIDDENRISELKSILEKSLGKEYENAKIYLYLKAKIQDSNLEDTNKNIIRFLKEENSSNIDTVQLDNGFSNVAYTKKYNPIKNNGKLIDFNIAVCSYTSGDYLIMGTPVITSTY